MTMFNIELCYEQIAHSLTINESFTGDIANEYGWDAVDGWIDGSVRYDLTTWAARELGRELTKSEIEDLNEIYKLFKEERCAPHSTKDQDKEKPMKTTFINLTPHAISLNTGETFAPSGSIARVSAGFSSFDESGICTQTFGEVSDLPEPAPDTNTIYIVSGLVLSALAGSRSDVVAPATGHPDCCRNDKGHIVSVPGFVR